MKGLYFSDSEMIYDSDSSYDSDFSLRDHGYWGRRISLFTLFCVSRAARYFKNFIIIAVSFDTSHYTNSEYDRGASHMPK